MIEKLLLNVDQEMMKKLLPIICKYLMGLTVENYIKLYNEIEETIKEIG